MKRMVLIPEERLLQYERQQGDVSHDTPKDLPNTQDGWGKEKEELSDDVIVRGIPKTMRTQAIALLERLRARSDVISWDDMGQVKIDGVFIPKSNISDLISSAMRPRKYFDPVASRPKDLVRNEEGWKKVTQKGKGRDRDYLFFGGGKGGGKRKKSSTEGQKGGTTFPLKDPYLRRWYGIEKKRKAQQKGGKLHKIPNWECYKG